VHEFGDWTDEEIDAARKLCDWCGLSPELCTCDHDWNCQCAGCNYELFDADELGLDPEDDRGHQDQDRN
jgi:hypothetical protein